MTSFVAHRRLLHPADAKLLRVSLTYVLPGWRCFTWSVRALVGAGQFRGMYGNHDGHWASWSARGILEWSGFLDFSPFSPLTGTGSPFAAQSAVAQPGRAGSGDPGAVAAAASCFDAGVFGGVVGVALSALPPPRVFAGAVFLATMLYICIFFIPFNGLHPRFTLVHARANERSSDRRR